MPLTADLLDNKAMLDTCSDSAAGFPPAEGLGETLEGGDGTKEPPSENINLV
ncbi:putative Band 4.1-like protein, partial [Naja naja]